MQIEVKTAVKMKSKMIRVIYSKKEREKRMIEALEKIGLRVEVLESFARTLEDTSHGNLCETDRAKVERIYALLTVLNDEIALLHQEVNAALSIEMDRIKKDREVRA